MRPEFCFPFEDTDVYQLGLDCNRRIAALRYPAGRNHLKNQAVRAADSMVLNLAEGWERGPGDAARNHFRIAKGSTAEAFAVIDLIGGPEPLKRDLRRVGAMLASLAR